MFYFTRTLRCASRHEQVQAIIKLKHCARNVWLKASPQVCLHDVPTHIVAGGIEPFSPITARASLIDENEKHFTSFAHFTADENGMIDLNKSPSLGGSFTGVFPSGLLTALKPAPNEFPYLRLYKRDTTQPWKVTISLHSGHENVEDCSDPTETIVLERHLLSPGVKRIPIREGRVRGVLYVPDGPGPHPGTIDMFGSVGGLMEFRSAMLASRGIASLALAFFAYDDLPKSLGTIELDYFEEAVDVLLSQPNIIPDRCGVIAISKAVDIALLMAIYLPKVKAIVSISGSPIAFDSIITYKNEVVIEGQKMTFDQLIMDEEGRVAPNIEIMMDVLGGEKAEIIPFYKSPKDKYFYFVAGDDDAWYCHLGLELARKKIENTDVEQNTITKIYPGAGHIIEPPYGSLIYHSFMRYLPVKDGEGDQVGSIPLKWGGKVKETCDAQEDFWPKMRAFLRHNIQEKSDYYQNYLHKKL